MQWLNGFDKAGKMLPARLECPACGAIGAAPAETPVEQIVAAPEPKEAIETAPRTEAESPEAREETPVAVAETPQPRKRGRPKKVR
jgi:hypothetical protein